jgi:p-hydroxybenzoate 3-monooxygenase
LRADWPMTGDRRFGVSDVQVDGITGEQPTITFTQNGQRQQLECDLVAGCDGSRTFTRYLIPEGTRTDFFRQYPFAWFGILAGSAVVG